MSAMRGLPLLESGALFAWNLASLRPFSGLFRIDFQGLKKMRVRDCKPSLGLVAAVVLLSAAAPAKAQTRAETLRYVTGASVNTLDPNVPGSTREAFAVSLGTYDRLVSFGRKQLNGKWVFDLDKITGELAET